VHNCNRRIRNLHLMILVWQQEGHKAVRKLIIQLLSPNAVTRPAT